jgi:hypothetical protein
MFASLRGEHLQARSFLAPSPMEKKPVSSEIARQIKDL